MSCINCTDQYSWLAVYTNGYLSECDDSGNHAVYADINQDQVVSLSWISKADGRVCSSINKNKDSNEKLILFRRRYTEVNSDGFYYTDRPPVHGLGVEKTLDGLASGNYIFLMIDGRTIHSNDRNLV